MAETTIERLNAFGQSVWLDNINRSMIEKGSLKDAIALGLRGITSNPTIFDKAISKSDIYNERVEKLYKAGKSTFEIYDDLTIDDVKDAADMFRPVYEKTSGLDGYVSLEINPKLADKTKETIEEGKRLYKKVNRPNLMLKVPSTDEGFKAIEELTTCGININVTLIFSLGQYKKSTQAYIRGIRRFLENNSDASKIRSVASIFVSRIDTAVDKILDGKIKETSSLKGKAAVANCRLIYGKYLQIFSSGDFKELQEKGANIQRVLWASTSTKNPDYSDIKYVTELIGKNTINTLPDPTFEAFLDHGSVKEALTHNVGSAEETIKKLKSYGIDIDKVLKELLEKGVIAFQDSFDSLLETLDKKTKKVLT